MKIPNIEIICNWRSFVTSHEKNELQYLCFVYIFRSKILLRKFSCKNHTTFYINIELCFWKIWYRFFKEKFQICKKSSNHFFIPGNLFFKKVEICWYFWNYFFHCILHCIGRWYSISLIFWFMIPKLNIFSKYIFNQWFQN